MEIMSVAMEINLKKKKVVFLLKDGRYDLILLSLIFSETEGQIKC